MKLFTRIKKQWTDQLQESCYILKAAEFSEAVSFLQAGLVSGALHIGQEVEFQGQSSLTLQKFSLSHSVSWDFPIDTTTVSEQEVALVH